MAEQPGAGRGTRPPRRGISDGELEQLRRQPAQALPVLAGAGPQLLLGGRALVVGWQLSNPGGAVDTLHLFDGSGANGAPLGDVTIPAGNSAPGSHPEGILCDRGITVTEAVGTITGVIYARFR